ncbi:DNA-binding protein [Arsenicitalea aurantiaca]|uniref:DNA-binding protein n=1 Tax=Arsenicitalea aurantiaca TaxID=1783274 RepID=A0A433XKZ3_9HYPH|nr:AAA family ATPase [Arsenicitalea aurantiaca]RUT34749.1 DNA-binding protein [Arsenicitalea aurantiaca]
MKLTALRLHDVKRFAGRGVAIENISSGVNVLTAANEHGKSTCFEALHALFFQAHTGTPGAVQLLRPYAGGNPLVEVDIETGNGRFRLTKQFYRGRRASVTDLGSGRLVAQADEAEAFIAELTRGGPAGPAGLLWVRQGLTGLERRSPSEERDERRVRETLLSSVQGEVEALTGGRRMAEILAACEAELDTLVTATMRPKTGGPYAAALAARDGLLIRRDALAADVEMLHAALERRRTAQARLAEIDNPEDAATRRADIAEAETAFEAARAHGDALRAAEAGLALAADRHRAAEAERRAFAEALARAEALAQSAAALTARRAECASRRDAARQTLDAAREAMTAAEARETEARVMMAGAEAAAAAREAADRLATLREHLARAETAREGIERLAALHAARVLSEKSVVELEALEIDLVGLRAARAATLPTLRIDYAPGAAPLMLADAPLAGAQDHPVSGTLGVDLPGIGRLTLRTPETPGAGEKLARAEARHRDVLAALGVESLAAARTRMAEAARLAGDLALARQALAQAAPEGLDALRAQCARLEATLGEAPELKFDPSAIRAALEDAGLKVQATRARYHEAGPALQRAAEELATLETDAVRIETETLSLISRLGPEPERAARHVALDAAARSAAEALATAEAAIAPLRAAGHDLAAAEARLRRVRSIDEAARTEASRLSITLAELNGQIRARADEAIEEALAETAEALQAAEARIARLSAEIATLAKLRSALSSARSAARDLYLRPVITELRPLIGLLFDDIVVEFDEDNLLPQRVRRNGQEEDVDRLSGGMREQLSVLTRLAFARLLANDGRQAPVILDDALVYSDDDRIERMFDALHREARDQQILVFSCRQRAFSRLGGNVLGFSPWTPPER